MLFIITLTLGLCPAIVATGGEIGSGRIGSGQCPDNVEAIMVYSPFKPYWKYPKFSGDMQKCWVATDCLLSAAGESRNQQFAATALIMGLIPLMLKDIAWPERRIVHISNPLSWCSKVLVLALGLVPLPAEEGAISETRRRSEESNGLAKYAWRLNKSVINLLVVFLAAVLITCYTGLVVNEIYSKRSALGCVYPLFITTWYIVALLPASIHSFFASRRKTLLEGMQRGRDRNQDATVSDHVRHDQNIPLQPHGPTRTTVWPVQMACGIYYIAGSLIFTSIMAVTVIELVVWIILCFAVTGCSKILAFFLCMRFEETGTGNRPRTAAMY